MRGSSLCLLACIYLCTPGRAKILGTDLAGECPITLTSKLLAVTDALLSSRCASSQFGVLATYTWKDTQREQCLMRHASRSRQLMTGSLETDLQAVFGAKVASTSAILCSMTVDGTAIAAAAAAAELPEAAASLASAVVGDSDSVPTAPVSIDCEGPSMPDITGGPAVAGWGPTFTGAIQKRADPQPCHAQPTPGRWVECGIIGIAQCFAVRRWFRTSQLSHVAKLFWRLPGLKSAVS